MGMEYTGYERWVVELPKVRELAKEVVGQALEDGRRAGGAVTIVLSIVITHIPSKSGADIRVSETNEALVTEYEHHVEFVLLRPFKELVETYKFHAETCIARNDSREAGLCSIAMECCAPRLYIGTKRKLIWGKDSMLATYCQANLPAGTRLMIVQQGKKVKEVEAGVELRNKPAPSQLPASKTASYLSTRGRRQHHSDTEDDPKYRLARAQESNHFSSVMKSRSSSHFPSTRTSPCQTLASGPEFEDTISLSDRLHSKPPLARQSSRHVSGDFDREELHGFGAQNEGGDVYTSPIDSSVFLTRSKTSPGRRSWGGESDTPEISKSITNVPRPSRSRTLSREKRIQSGLSSSSHISPYSSHPISPPPNNGSPERISPQAYGKQSPRDVWASLQSSCISSSEPLLSSSDKASILASMGLLQEGTDIQPLVKAQFDELHFTSWEDDVQPDFENMIASTPSPMSPLNESWGSQRRRYRNTYSMNSEDLVMGGDDDQYSGGSSGRGSCVFHNNIPNGNGGLDLDHLLHELSEIAGKGRKGSKLPSLQQEISITDPVKNNTTSMFEGVLKVGHVYDSAISHNGHSLGDEEYRNREDLAFARSSRNSSYEDYTQPSEKEGSSCSTSSSIDSTEFLRKMSERAVKEKSILSMSSSVRYSANFSQEIDKLSSMNVTGASGSSGDVNYPCGSAEHSDCRQFSLEQLTEATNNFSEDELLGRGAYGPVYKGNLFGCKVAIKKLEAGSEQGPAEFHMEVEVLSKIRHPNIVLLMGQCPEEACIVYEFMQGGNLQSRIVRSGPNAPPPLQWFDRIRIISEISGALLYMHSHRPPILHRDLKPDNILLDTNLISKIADVGLARLIPEDDRAVTWKVRGTAGYIDPEEIQTGELSVKSDIYAFGLIVLQLLTGLKNVKQLHKLLQDCGSGCRDVEMASRILLSNLDSSAGRWPKNLAARAIRVAVRCVERKRSQRPDLATQIQPEFTRIHHLAMDERANRAQALDNKFICPLSGERMVEPVVAADGNTYERRCIEAWLSSKDVSPVSGEPFSHKSLTPNHILASLMDTYG